MLNFFIKNYNLKCFNVLKEIALINKPKTISSCEKAKKIGFISKSSSIENIKHFSEKFLVYIKNQKTYYRALLWMIPKN